MKDKKLQEKKENMKKTINEEIDKFFDNKEEYELVNKIIKERNNKKEELKKFAENYLGFSYFESELSEEDLNKCRRLGYYEVMKDCLEFLQLGDKDMQFGFANTCIEKGK